MVLAAEPGTREALLDLAPDGPWAMRITSGERAACAHWPDVGVPRLLALCWWMGGGLRGAPRRSGQAMMAWIKGKDSWRGLADARLVWLLDHAGILKAHGVHIDPSTPWKPSRPRFIQRYAQRVHALVDPLLVAWITVLQRAVERELLVAEYGHAVDGRLPRPEGPLLTRCALVDEHLASVAPCLSPQDPLSISLHEFRGVLPQLLANPALGVTLHLKQALPSVPAVEAVASVVYDAQTERWAPFFWALAQEEWGLGSVGG